jgi:hypothetical protein
VCIWQFFIGWQIFTKIRYDRVNGLLVPVDAGWVGEHEGFPASELYINRNRVFQYNPFDVGASPLELIGGLIIRLKVRLCQLVFSSRRKRESIDGEFAIDTNDKPSI